LTGGYPPAVEFAWHGGASLSLRLGGLEVLVDPAFSRPGDYPAWFDEKCANPGAPTFEDYLSRHQPSYLFITHGHFDHFDLPTVARLAAAFPEMRVAGSSEVTRTCRQVLGLKSARLLHLTPGGWTRLSPAGSGAGGPRVRAVPGPHWFTGDEGEAVAAKLAGRPDRFGAMPCGGPMLGLVFEPAPAGERKAGDGPDTAWRVYVSGDTEPGGLAPGPFDVAIVSCGGRLLDPATRRPTGPYFDEETLAAQATEVLRAAVLIPVHYDHPVFLTPFDTARLAAGLKTRPGAPRLLVPPYNTWVTVRE
jgi:L-ascorbate metabolism protein UlaG (beta-lactamase superfamily)